MPPIDKNIPDPSRPNAIRNRVAVNRANARASTGPKSAAGKATVARNVLRHGFAAIRFAEPQPGSEVAALARDIAGPQAAPDRFAAALSIAQGQIDLQRVRRLRHGLLDRALSSAESMRDRTLTSPEVAATAVAEFTQILREMVALGRYESRAVTRRKRAIRTFDETRRTNLGPGTGDKG